MKTVLHNRTDLPVAETVSWALQMTSTDRDDLWIQVCRTGHHAHHGWIRWRETRFRVFAYVPLIYPYTCTATTKAGPPAVDPQCWEEALVCILGHELTHVNQVSRGARTKGYTRRAAQPHWRSTPSGRKVWVEPTQEEVQVDGQIYDEVEAEWAEHALLHLYRREQER